MVSKKTDRMEKMPKESKRDVAAKHKTDAENNRYMYPKGDRNSAPKKNMEDCYYQ
jgi:hypothetical protein